MSKKSVMLTCMLMLGAAGTAQATPLDAPDIVYIDGLPCNSVCQSYMAWSRATSSMSARPANVVAHRAAGIRGERSKLAAYARMAKQAAPNSSRMPKVDSHPPGGVAAKPNTRTLQKQVAELTNNTDRSDRAETVRRGDADKTVAASPDNPNGVPGSGRVVS